MSSLRKRKFLFWAGWGFHLFFFKKNGDFLGIGTILNFVNILLGHSSYGQLGLGDKRDRILPEKVPKFNNSLIKILETSIGTGHSLFLTEKHVAYSCGKNNAGQLSIVEKTKECLTPQKVVFLDGTEDVGIIGVFCDAEASSFFLSRKGDVYSVGLNTHGQLGLGDCEERLKAEKIKTLKNISNVFAASQWVVFQSRDSSLYCCGKNNNSIKIIGWNRAGQLAQGDKYMHGTEYHNVPCEITFFNNNSIKINHVVCSWNTVYYLTKENNVYGCGRNQDGELGNGTWEAQSKPVLLKELSGCQEICSGYSACFMIYKKNGILYGIGETIFFPQYIIPQLGENKYEGDGYSRMGLGQNVLKTNEPIEITFPTRLLKGRKVAEIITARVNSYLILSDGTIFSTGDGEYGQLIVGRTKGSQIFAEAKDMSLKRCICQSIEKNERLDFLSSKMNLLEMIRIQD